MTVTEHVLPDRNTCLVCFAAGMCREVSMPLIAEPWLAIAH